MEQDLFITEEIRNDELLKLMHEMRQERTSEKMLEVLKLAAASAFIVPVDASPDGRFSFHAVGDNKGRRFIVAYADTGSFMTSEKSEAPKGVKASFEDLMDVVLQESLRLDGVIINPGAAEVIFGKELIESIKGQMAPSEEEQPTLDMQVATPAEYPAKLKEMIEQFAADEPRMSKVWVKLLVTPDGSTMRWLLGVEAACEGEELNYLLDTFKRFVTPYLNNIEPVVASSGEDFVQQAVKDAEPYYARS